MKPYLIYIISIFAGFLFSQEEILWDLGLVIYPNSQFQRLSAEKIYSGNAIKDSTLTGNFITTENRGINVKLPEHTLHKQVAGLSEKLHITQMSLEDHNRINQNSKGTQIDQSSIIPSLLFEDDKSNVKSLQKRGTDSFRSGRYKEALDYLTKIDHDSFSNSEQNKITYLTANAYFQLGEYTKAKEYLHPLIVQRFSPEADDALMLLGMIYKKQHKKDYALQMFRQVILDFPDSEFYESARIQTRILSQNK